MTDDTISTPPIERETPLTQPMERQEHQNSSELSIVFGSDDCRDWFGEANQFHVYRGETSILGTALMIAISLHASPAMLKRIPLLRRDKADAVISTLALHCALFPVLHWTRYP